MKHLLSLFILAVSTHAHSWLDCVDTQVPNYAEAKANPSIQPIHNCNGYPRNKAMHGAWVDESTHYSWNLLHPETNKAGLSCNPTQTNMYPPAQPMTTAKPGSKLMLRHWGNGHARWDIGLPVHKDPGLVRLYWKGAKEKEITLRSELTEANWMVGAQANFSADAISVPMGDRPDDRGNYFHVTLPGNIENGRHMMVWTWAGQKGLLVNKPGWKEGDYNNEWQDTWSTCFDIMIVDSAHQGDTYAPDQRKSSAPAREAGAASVCEATACRKGGSVDSANACKGPGCPPCRYKKPDGVDCYEYKDGKCPFGGAFDCVLNKQV